MTETTEARAPSMTTPVEEELDAHQATVEADTIADCCCGDPGCPGKEVLLRQKDREIAERDATILSLRLKLEELEKENEMLVAAPDLSENGTP